MKIEFPGEPLNRFAAMRTSNPDVFGEAARSVYGVTRFEIPTLDGFDARGNFLQLEDIALGFSACGARVIADFPEADFARLQIGLSGSAGTTIGGVTTPIDPQHCCITSPYRAAVLDYGDGFEQLILRVKASAIERKLVAMIGNRPKGTIAFEASVRGDAPQAINLRNLVVFVCGQLNSTTVQLPPLMLSELEQAITVGFLSAYRHNFSSLLEREAPDCAPRHVREVEDYIEAHWNQPLSIEKLMTVTNISARAVFKAFQRSRGYTPMAFAKRVRVQHARQMLAAPTATTTVTAVAFACGFSNLGHFAKDYRKLVGERPSETLQRARTARGL
jgi:AraC-like DNA-binding protein